MQLWPCLQKKKRDTLALLYPSILLQSNTIINIVRSRFRRLACRQSRASIYLPNGCELCSRTVRSRNEWRSSASLVSLYAVCCGVVASDVNLIIDWPALLQSTNCRVALVQHMQCARKSPNATQQKSVALRRMQMYTARFVYCLIMTVR